MMVILYWLMMIGSLFGIIPVRASDERPRVAPERILILKAGDYERPIPCTLTSETDFNIMVQKGDTGRDTAVLTAALVALDGLHKKPKEIDLCVLEALCFDATKHDAHKWGVLHYTPLRRPDFKHTPVPTFYWPDFDEHEIICIKSHANLASHPALAHAYHGIATQLFKQHPVLILNEIERAMTLATGIALRKRTREEVHADGLVLRIPRALIVEESGRSKISKIAIPFLTCMNEPVPATVSVMTDMYESTPLPQHAADDVQYEIITESVWEKIRRLLPPPALVRRRRSLLPPVKDRVFLEAVAQRMRKPKCEQAWHAIDVELFGGQWSVASNTWSRLKLRCDRDVIEAIMQEAIYDAKKKSELG
jgi:hypothetical protein